MSSSLRLRRQHGRQAERGNQRGEVERRDFGDAVTLDSQDVDHARPVIRIPGFPQVIGDRRQSVRRRYHVSEVVVGRLAEAILHPRLHGGAVAHAHEGRRWHAEACIVAQQSCERGGVHALARVHVLPDEPHLCLADRARGHGLIAPGLPAPQRFACALECPVDRRDTRLEQIRDLLGGPFEHVAQDEHGALFRRQTLQRHEEGELDRLAPDHERIRVGVARRRQE